MGKKQKEPKDATDEMLDKFEELCEEYANEDIDTKKLLKGTREIINNFSG